MPVPTLPPNTLLQDQRLIHLHTVKTTTQEKQAAFGNSARKSFLQRTCPKILHPKVQLFTSQSTVERSMAGLDRSRDTAWPGVGAVVAVEGPWDVASSV